MALLASAWDRDLSGGSSRVGLVVGATDIDALKRVRALVPDMWILAPGTWHACDVGKWTQHGRLWSSGANGAVGCQTVQG